VITGRTHEQGFLNPDQIKQLEEKKKQIQDKIDAVTDEARKKGLEPGQLR